jgi:hypothetical protein
MMAAQGDSRKLLGVKPEGEKMKLQSNKLHLLGDRIKL